MILTPRLPLHHVERGLDCGLRENDERLGAMMKVDNSIG